MTSQAADGRQGLRTLTAVGPEPVVVISPHLDDGVLACGALLAARPGSVVITAFAGRPLPGSGLTEWDSASGFGPGEDPVGARREEDQLALAGLAARPIWLEFRDSQYHDTPSIEALAPAIEAAILETGLQTVLFPIGVFHSDHKLVNAACLGIARRLPEWAWFAYEDALYRTIPGLLEERLAELRQGGILLGPPLGLPADTDAKRRAVGRYQSQIRALATPGRLTHADAFTEERYRRLALRSVSAACPE